MMPLFVEPAGEAAFKRAVGSFASGVNLVTMRDGSGRPHGVTVSAFSSVSLDPLLVLICMNRENRTHDLIVETGRFGINVLSPPLCEVSNVCARPGGDKVLESRLLVADTDARSPVLKDALAHLDCRLWARHEAGTHSVLIGQVEMVGHNSDAEAEPLLYFRGGYKRLERSLSAKS
jgi:flavin reductase (DIM6/NTAB) family NADH-FMN oxidoreductase RutF